MAGVVAILWMIFQPLLFGLIGSEVDLAKIDADSVGKEENNLYRYIVKSWFNSTNCPVELLRIFGDGIVKS